MHLLVNNKTYIVQSIAYVSILKRDLHVQTKANLRKRRVNILDNNYSGLFCFHEEEITNHLFFNCSFSHEVWSHCYRWVDILGAQHYQSCRHFEQSIVSKELVQKLIKDGCWRGSQWCGVCGCIETPSFLQMKQQMRKGSLNWQKFNHDTGCIRRILHSRYHGTLGK